MTLESAISNIRREHRNCCLTDSYQENRCRLDITGLDRSSVTTIDGTNYQSNHKWQGRLCDRIIFGRLGELFVCAVELKGGRSTDVSVAIEQIQGGVNLATLLLQSLLPEKCYPLLLYSGSMPKRERDVFLKTTISYRGKKMRVDRIDCGSSLLDYLNRQQRLADLRQSRQLNSERE